MQNEALVVFTSRYVGGVCVFIYEASIMDQKLAIYDKHLHPKQHSSTF